MASDFALVRIVRVVDPNSTSPSIRVKQLLVKQGNAFDGDLQVLDVATGTDVKFGLAKRLVDEDGKVFAFKSVPICIEDHTVSPPSSPCQPGQTPPGFTISSAAPDSFVLNVPQLNNGAVSYKYRLFMMYTRPNGTTKDVTIDPKITNGGQPFTGDRSAIEGLSALTLVVLAFLLLSTGIAFGWVLSGGRRP